MAKKHGMMFIGEEHSCCFVKDQDIYMTGKLLNDVYQLDFTCQNNVLQSRNGITD
jgi:hypothetical protein